MRKNDVPELDKLFRMLARGETPDFLQMMQALSDVSTIFPEVSTSSLLNAEDKNRANPPYLCPQDEEKCPSCSL